MVKIPGIETTPRLHFISLVYICFSVLQVSKCMETLSRCCCTVLEGYSHESLQLQELQDAFYGGACS